MTITHSDFWAGILHSLKIWLYLLEVHVVEDKMGGSGEQATGKWLHCRGTIQLHRVAILLGVSRDITTFVHRYTDLASLWTVTMIFSLQWNVSHWVTSQTMLNFPSTLYSRNCFFPLLLRRRSHKQKGTQTECTIIIKQRVQHHNTPHIRHNLTINLSFSFNCFNLSSSSFAALPASSCSSS